MISDLDNYIGLLGDAFTPCIKKLSLNAACSVIRLKADRYAIKACVLCLLRGQEFSLCRLLLSVFQARVTIYSKSQCPIQQNFIDESKQEEAGCCFRLVAGFDLTNVFRL